MATPLIGVGIWGMQSTAWYPRAHPALYREMVEEIVLAEELGFDFALFTEHHFAPDGSCPSLLLAAAAAGQATSRIGIGTGLLLLPLHQPQRLLAQVGTLHALLGQRLILGVGLGYRAIEFVGRSQERSRRVALLEERIALLRQQTAELGTPPLDIWVGGHVEATARRAGRLGCGLMFPSNVDLGELARFFRIHEALLPAEPAESASSRWKRRRGALRSVWVAPTDDEAREYALPRLRYLWEQQYGAWGMFEDIARHDKAQSYGDTSDQAAQASGHAIVGSPDTVASGLRQVFAAGAHFVVCRIQTGTQSHEPLLDCLRLLGTEVLPRLREEPA